MQKVNCNILDFLLLCYSLMAGFNFYFTHQNRLCLFEVAKWSTFLLCYIVARKISHKERILWGIIFLGMVEGIIAIFQKTHWLNSVHHDFNVTGTFSNPGPLGGFMGATITIILGLYLTKKCFIPKWALFTIFILFCFILLLADSRAGFLSTLFGMATLCCLFKKMKVESFVLIKSVSLFLFMILFIISIYYYKKDSADGRLLIWRVSIDMIADAPLVGHGIGTFENKYMYYQAQYFESHPYSKYEKLADNIVYPYNEFLRIGVEQGIIGIIFILCIIASIFKYTSKEKYNKVYLGGFVSLLTFSMFSYPFNVLLLWLLGSLLLGGIQYQKNIYALTKYKFQSSWIIIVCLVLSIKGGHDYYNLKLNVRKLYSESLQKRKVAEAYIERCQVCLQSTPPLLDVYAQYSFLQLPATKSLLILKQASTIIPSSELYCDLGDVYKEQKQIDKAMECYILAKNMLPNRLLPKYKLFCLYREQRDSIKMYKIGQEALLTEIKITSTKALRIKKEIKRSLSQRCDKIWQCALEK